MEKRRILKTETLQKQTSKRFPNCRTAQDEYGLWYIIDMNGDDTFKEFFLPHVSTEREAWEMGKLTAQTIQNFNRTHPLKVDMVLNESGEMKQMRVNKRRKKNK